MILSQENVNDYVWFILSAFEWKRKTWVLSELKAVILPEIASYFEVSQDKIAPMFDIAFDRCIE